MKDPAGRQSAGNSPSSSLKATAATVQKLSDSFRRRKRENSARKPFTATSAEITTFVDAIRAFPAAENVLRPAWEALFCCAEMGLSSAVVDAGAAEALFACRTHDPASAWLAASILCVTCEQERMHRLVDAGWADAALSLLPTSLESPWLEAVVKVLTRCITDYEPCAKRLIRRGVLKARQGLSGAFRNPDMRRDTT